MRAKWKPRDESMTPIRAFHHVNVTVVPALEEATKDFYRSVLGLKEVPKPEETRGRGGAWYQIGDVQLHISREQAVNNEGAKRHFCLLVSSLEQMQKRFEDSGVTILPDEQPIHGTKRFYVRDPGGNLIEIAQDRNA